MSYNILKNEPIGNIVDDLTSQPIKGNPIAAVGLAISAFSTMKQMSAAKDAKKAGRQQAEAQRNAEMARGRQSEVEAQRQRISQVRESRIRKAQVISSTGNEGLGFAGTSGNVGAVSGITSQTASNIGFIGQQQGFASEISDYNIQAGQAGSDMATAQATGAQWQTIGGIGNSIFQAKGGWTTIFGGNTHKTAGA